MKLRALLLLASMLRVITTVAQGEMEPTKSQVSSFQLGSDNVGSLANSVNTFTGDLNFPISLVSTSAHGGIGINLNLTYNSNIQQISDVWNYEAPTGALGLGWSMDGAAIIADFKSTASRDDDDFYLIEGNVSTPLVYSHTIGAIRYFNTRIHRNWIFAYTATSEKWEITRDDGVKLIYGDPANQRNATEYMVTWSNWFGTSMVSIGQTLLAVKWNLVEAVNLFQEKILLTYVQSTQQAGLGGLTYTQSNYLWKISNTWGDEVELIYADKLTDEYPDPHAENGAYAVDAYQERLETKYLSKVLTKVLGETTSEVRFEYNTTLMGTGLFTKRLLQSISRYAADGVTRASYMNFTYLSSGPMKGALQSIETNLGGTVTFDYHAGLSLAKSNRNLSTYSMTNASQNDCPTWHGEDYVVTFHDGGSNNTITVHQWSGQWVTGTFFNLGSVTMKQGYTCRPDIQVVTSKDFVAILKKIVDRDYRLYLIHKNATNNGWTKEERDLQWGATNFDANRVALYAGDDFVAVTDNRGNIETYTWDGQWNNHSIQEYLTESHHTTVGPNYIIDHKKGLPQVLRFHYLKGKRSWNAVTINNAPLFGSGESYWHGANTYAVVMANGGNERVMSWTPDYSSFTFTDLNVALVDTDRVMVGPAMFTILSPLSKELRTYRFNGNAWISTGVKHYEVYDHVSFGEDIMLWQSTAGATPESALYKSFNPNNWTWDGDVEINYTRNANIFHFTETGNPSETGNGYFIIADRIYWRRANGAIESQELPYGGKSIYGRTVRSGVNFFAFGGASAKAYLQPIKNGALGPLRESTGSINYFWYSRYRVGATNFATGQLYNVVNGEFTGLAVDYPITRVTVNDGLSTTYTSYSYDATTAYVDPSGSVAKYREVKIIPGSASSTETPNGYTKIYYINDADGASASGLFDKNIDLAIVGDAGAHYKLLVGMIYRTEVYNANNTRLSASTNAWSVLSMGKNVYSVTLLNTSHETDGFKTYNDFEYAPTTRQLRRQITNSATSSNVVPDVTTTIEYVYCWEKYYTLLNNNIVGPIFQTSKKVGSSYVESSVSRWKPFQCIGCQTGETLAPWETYAWQGTGTPDFDLYAPQSTWTLLESILERDGNTGSILTRQLKGDIKITDIPDTQRRYVVATAINPTPSALIPSVSIYEGFETYSSDVTSESKTGKKGYTGVYNVIVPSLITGGYKLTYWQKVGTQEWQLVEANLTSTSTPIGGAGTIIDEVRVHPVGAKMTSYSFDLYGNVTSVCDENNWIEYREYDQLGRLKIIRDRNKNILKHNSYQTRN